MDETKLLSLAREAQQNSYAPYSGIKIGAALLAADGRVCTGCNIENASYGATVCAERVALFKAVSEGVTAFRALAVAGSTAQPPFPCGLCRQALWEFAPDLTVYTQGEAGEVMAATLADLLPSAFSIE